LPIAVNSLCQESRVARFFLVQTFQIGKNITNDHKLYQLAIKYSNGLIITNIYHSKALQNLPKFGIFGMKTSHLATLRERRKAVTASRSLFFETCREKENDKILKTGIFRFDPKSVFERVCIAKPGRLFENFVRKAIFETSLIRKLN
jgi:hypothetical protein